MAVNSSAVKLNRSFLVLNLDANTVGVENSHGFQPFPLRVSGCSFNAAPKNGHDQVGDVVSREEKQDMVKESLRNGEASMEKGSSRVIWTRNLEKRERMRRMESGARKRKRKARTIGQRNALRRKKEVRESMPRGTACVSPAEGNDMSNSGWSPPQYLLNLLGFFGWKVELRRGLSGFVYVSPQGVTYSSLPKVFEIFLHGNWRSGDLTQHLTSGEFSLNGEINVENGGSSKEKARIRRGRTGKNGEVTKPGVVLAAGRVGRCTRSMMKSMESQVALRISEDSSHAMERRVNVRNSSAGEVQEHEEMNPSGTSCGKSCQIRRSSRLSRKSASKDSQCDLEVESSSDCTLVLDDDDKEKTASTSDSEYELDDASDASSDYEYPRTSTGNARELVSLRKDLKNMRGIELDDEIQGDTDICNVDKDETHPVSSNSQSFYQGPLLVLPHDKKDLAVIACNMENDKPASCPSLPCSRHTIEGFNACNVTFDSTCAFIDPMKVIEKNTATGVTMKMEAVIGEDSDKIEYVAADGLDKIGSDKEIVLNAKDDLVKDKNAEPNDNVQQGSQVKRRKKQKRIQNGRCEDDETSLLLAVDSTSLQAESVIETLITEKISCPSKKRKSFTNGYAKGRKKKRRSRGCSLLVRKKGKGDHHEDGNSQPNATVLSWLIDTGILTENEKVVHMLKNGRKQRLRGFVTRAGIRCNCCKTVITLSEFDAHAGSTTNQPWSNISRASGELLIQSLATAWSKIWAHKSEQMSAVGGADLDSSDDTCGICADGGCLLCCDTCSSTFHKDCLLLEDLPVGSWYCPHCTCKFCNMIGDENSLLSTLLTCSQCHCKYHLECAVKNDIPSASQKPALFCQNSCMKVDAELSNMIGIRHAIPNGFSWTLLKRSNEDVEIVHEGHSAGDTIVHEDHSTSAIECRIKLAVALSVLEECFIPLVDKRTGLDMLSQAVYNCGSHFKRLSYEGFYTVILEKDEEIISAATLRVHGTCLAEMPFIGTRPVYQRKGMCRRLLESIEDMLSSLHVRNLIIPSIPELLETWMTTFHFQPLEPHLSEEIRRLSLVVFAETTLLQKAITTKGKHDDECGAIEDIKGCADDWIETLISTDEEVHAWFGLCCDSKIVNVNDNQENAGHHEGQKMLDIATSSPPGVSAVLTEIKNQQCPLDKSESRLSGTSPPHNDIETTQAARPIHSGLKPFFSLPSYDRPFSATNMGIPRWIEAKVSKNSNNDYTTGGFATTESINDHSTVAIATTVRRQLFFGGSVEINARETGS